MIIKYYIFHTTIEVNSNSTKTISNPHLSSQYRIPYHSTQVASISIVNICNRPVSPEPKATICAYTRMLNNTNMYLEKFLKSSFFKLDRLNFRNNRNTMAIQENKTLQKIGNGTLELQIEIYLLLRRNMKRYIKYLKYSTPSVIIFGV